MGRTKRVVVGGLGEVGQEVVAVLVQEGCEVTAVDVDPLVLDLVEGQYDVRTLRGNIASGHVLDNLDLSRQDALVASTGDDDVNLVAALKAREKGIRWCGAVVDSVEFFDQTHGIYRDWLGIDLVVNTKLLVANEIAKLIRTKGAVAVEDFAHNRIEMAQFRVVDETLYTERPLRELELPWDCLIVAIKRKDKLLIPRGSDSIYVGDEVTVLARTDLMPDIAEALGRTAAARQSIVLLGGGTVGIALVRRLSGLEERITLIEKDRARCEELAQVLDGVTIIHGDATEIAVLAEQGIETCEVFAAVSGEDERNIIAARLAKELGASRSIALLSRRAYVDVCRHLGLEVAENPSRIAAREVVKELVPSPLVAVTPVLGGGAFLEFTIGEGAPVAWKALRDVEFPKGSLVCALFDEDGFVFPRGDAILTPGSRTIVFSLVESVPRVKRLFRT